MLFSQMSLGGTSWNMKNMPMIFLFSASRDSLYNMRNYYWKPFLVRKIADFMKAYIISILTPVIH